MTDQRWWHVYGYVVPEGDLGGCWQMVIAGDTDVKPADAASKVGGMSLLGSFDHDPTDAEKESLTPEEFRDA